MINLEKQSNRINTFNEEDKHAVNAVRMLSVDMIQKANSGHPGICLDAAPMAYVLWNYHMNVNPKILPG